MRDFSSETHRKVWAFLALALGVLASAPALAANSFYIAVQPIDVCRVVSRTQTYCPLINDLPQANGTVGQTALTNPGTNQIGFFDTSVSGTGTNIDLTRAMLNQIGIDVTWQPVAQFNSPATNTGSWGTTDYLTLHVVQQSSAPCSFTPTQTSTGLISCDFLTLSQQPSISKGTVPSPTTPAKVPVSSNPTTINMFFVDTIQPPPGQTGLIYGFSWINNNGIAIANNPNSGGTFSGNGIVSGPRFDTIAHEIGHNLALTHDSYGAGASAIANLETAGCCNANGFDLRTEPSSPGCLSTGGALYDLGTGQCSPQASPGTADQLTPGASGTTTQQGQAYLSNLLNPIQTVQTSGSKKSSGGLASAASGPSPFDAVSGNCNSDAQFTVSYPGDSSGGRNEYLAVLDFTLPAGLRFLNNTFKPLDPVAQRAVAKVSVANNGDLVIVLNKGAYPPPPQPSSTPASFQFTVGVVDSTGSCQHFSTTSLQGTHLMYVFSDGYSPTTTLICNGVSCSGASNSPDLAIASVIQNPNTFVGANTFGQIPPLACTPIIVGFSGEQAVYGCPDPRQTGVEDGDPTTQGGNGFQQSQCTACD